jgi:hypothetical protein
MMDPKSAAKFGNSIGKGLTDGVFGIVDTVRNAKTIKAQNNSKIAAQNKVTDINNQIVRQNNALREQAMREIAAEQEKAALMKMSKAQREEYYRLKAEAAKEAHRLKLEAERKQEEFWEAVLITIAIVVILAMLGGGLFLMIKFM